MAAVTLLTLRTRVRSRADMVAQLAFLPDAELNEFINASAQELHDLLIATFSGDYRHSTSTPTIVAGTEAYNLASDFYKLLGVDCVVSGKTVSLKPWTWGERHTYRSATGQIPRYRIENSQIRFLPAPRSVLTITIHYAPPFVVLAADGDEVNFPNGWEEYIVIDAAIKCLVKEESDTSALERAKGAKIAQILASAPIRDQGAPPSAVDVEASDPADPRLLFY